MATTAEHGMLRTEVDYAWPAIFRPAYEVKLVYLDLNQWIGLAKAATGHKDGARYLQALEAARAAKDAGTAMFPLSGTHYMELAGIGSFRHRSDIAGVMEELSDFSTILSRAVLTKCEVEAALTARFGSRPDLYSPLTLLNFGVGPAFGMVGGLRFRNRAGRDVTEEARLEHPDGPEEFDRMLREMNIKLERAMLRGPSPHEAEELRAAQYGGDHRHDHLPRREDRISGRCGGGSRAWVHHCLLVGGGDLRGRRGGLRPASALRRSRSRTRRTRGRARSGVTPRAFTA